MEKNTDKKTKQNNSRAKTKSRDARVSTKDRDARVSTKSRSTRRGFFDEALLSFEDDRAEAFAGREGCLITENGEGSKGYTVVENGEGSKGSAEEKTEARVTAESFGKPEGAKFGVTEKKEEAEKEGTPERKDSKNIIIIALVSALLLCALLVFKLAFDKGFFGEKEIYSDGNEENPKYKPILYEPDFETDIFTLEEYLALDRRVIYSPDGAQRYELPNGDFSSEGEAGLIVIGEYLNAAISGDHERLNEVFTDEYFKENERYGRIPPQKIFETKIKKHLGSLNQGGTRAYFIVSYKIYLNDGLFRDDIDEDTEIAQLFEICLYSDGTGKINKIVNLPGYQV